MKPIEELFRDAMKAADTLMNLGRGLAHDAEPVTAEMEIAQKARAALREIAERWPCEVDCFDNPVTDERDVILAALEEK